jgi:hypothetical protein
MEDARFNRAVRLLFIVLGVVDVVAGAGFALGADAFGYDPQFAWAAGGIFFLLGLGMLTFVYVRGRRGPD